MEETATKSYAEFKKELDKEIQNQAESFVKTGFLFRIANDTNILQETGYESVVEFAKKEYGLGKDQVSRYIRINEKYSKGGYSEELDDRYKGFGYSKLAEMLTLPEEIADALSPEMTRQQIQKIKQEVKEEQQITPLEVLTEKKNQGQQELKTDIQLFLHQYGYECREKFKELSHAAAKEDYIERILDAIAPSGVAMLTVRIARRGKLMLSVTGKENDLKLLDVREASRNTSVTWEQLKEAVITVYAEGTEEAWENIYGEPFEKEEEKQIEEPERTKSEQQSEEKAAVRDNIVTLKQPNTVQKSRKVAPVQQEKEKTKEGIAILAECVYAVIKQYREKLMNLSEYTVDTVKDALAIEATHFETWLEFIVEGVRYEAQVHTQAISQTKEVVIYEADSAAEEYVWFIDEVYKEIADVLNCDEEALQDEQIPRQATIDDYPEVHPEENVFTTVAFRCLPNDIVHFLALDRVEEAKVTEVKLGENLIPMITVKATDPNAFIVVEFNQKEDWGKKLFRTRAAAEQALKQ